jgi:hypothetical protein
MAANEKYFADPDSRKAALGQQTGPNDLIWLNPTGSETYAIQNGGALDPMRYDIEPGTPIYSFTKVTGELKRMIGRDWWVDRSSLDQIIRLSQVNHVSMGRAVRVLCSDRFSHELNLLIAARTRVTLAAWRGLGNSAAASTDLVSPTGRGHRQGRVRDAGTQRYRRMALLAALYTRPQGPRRGGHGVADPGRTVPAGRRGDLALHLTRSGAHSPADTIEGALCPVRQPLTWTRVPRQTFPLDQPRWSGSDHAPLLLTPLPGLTRAQRWRLITTVYPGQRTAWAGRAQNSRGGEAFRNVGGCRYVTLTMSQAASRSGESGERFSVR